MLICHVAGVECTFQRFCVLLTAGLYMTSDKTRMHARTYQDDSSHMPGLVDAFRSALEEHGSLQNQPYGVVLVSVRSLETDKQRWFRHPLT